MERLNFYRYHAKGWGDWLLRAFPKAPRLELLALRRDIANRRDRGRGALRQAYDQYRHDPVPQIIWMYWDSGEAGMPFIVRRCVDSWRRHNPDWELRILDMKTVSDYADMSDYPDVGLGPRFYADLLRLRLLRDHGGVWADATVYCHRPLSEWLNLQTTSGFFAFKRPGRDRLLSSWFLVSVADHIIPKTWEVAFTKYLQRIKRQPHIYFVYFYLLEWVLRKQPEVEQSWSAMAGLPAVPSLLMMPVLQGQGDEDVLRRAFASGLPVSKLSWKTDLTEADFDAAVARLDAGAE